MKREIYKVYHCDDFYEICHSIAQIIDYLNYLKTWGVDLTIAIYYKEQGDKYYCPFLRAELEDSLIILKEKLLKNT